MKGLVLYTLNNFFAGGWNNNPTAMQFQSIFRHLMIKCGVRAGISGNAVPQDSTAGLFVTPETASPLIPPDSDESPTPFVRTNEVSDFDDFGILVENALVYVAGFVVKKVLQQLQCDECRFSLVTDAITSSSEDHYHLLVLRNNGGLMIPSEGVVKVIRVAESCLRMHGSVTSASFRPCSVLQVDSFVRRKIGSEDIFHLEDHIADTQDCIDNHHYRLMSFIVHSFYNLRQHHIAKLHTRTLQLGSRRVMKNKTVLFQGH